MFVSTRNSRISSSSHCWELIECHSVDADIILMYTPEKVSSTWHIWQYRGDKLRPKPVSSQSDITQSFEGALDDPLSNSQSRKTMEEGLDVRARTFVNSELYQSSGEGKRNLREEFYY